MKYLTLNEAKQALLSAKSEKDLLDILNSVDIKPIETLDDAKTLLYSGVGQIPDDILTNEKIRLLDNTPAAKLIQTIEFNDVVNNLFSSKEEANNFLYKTNGGAWDTISKRFVEATTHHEVSTLIGESASAQRTFFQTELPALKANPNITHIDGIEKQTLFKKLDALGDPQHQLNFFKTITYTRNKVAEALKIKPLELDNEKIQAFFNSNSELSRSVANDIDKYKTNLYAKTEVSKASGIPYNKITENYMETFLSKNEEISNKIGTYARDLAFYNPYFKDIDFHTHGKYTILGAIVASALTEASPLHVVSAYDPHYDTFNDAPPKSSQLDVQIGLGFNGINAIQASQEFKAGASKSPTVLLSPDAYKDGLKDTLKEVNPKDMYVGIKDTLKLGAKEGSIVAGKSLLKKLPFIGLVAGIAFGIGRAMDGDFNGAAMEIASGAASIVPGWGTLASVGIDTALLEKDTHFFSDTAKKFIDRESKTEILDNHNTKPSYNMDLNLDNKPSFENVNQNEIKREYHLEATIKGITETQKNEIAKGVEKCISSEDSSTHQKMMISGSGIATSKLSDLNIVYSTDSAKQKEIEKTEKCIIDNIYQNLSFTNPQQCEESLDLDRGMD